MCGISGLIGLTPNISLQKVQAMNGTMQHRGPNDSGTFSHNQFCIGQTRLSIIDVSNNAHQPMESSCGNYCIVFNGEIYNFKLLRQQLVSQYPHLVFASNSDTEVLLYAYKYWGLAMLQKLEGMFAFAIIDKLKNELFVARDRYGVKPFYYTSNSNYFVFASEIKAILKTELSKNTLNTSQLATYLQWQTVYDPYTLVEDIKSLPAGCYGIFSNDKFDIKKYYNIETYAKAISSDSKDIATEKVYTLLYNAVQKRLVSDVPLGVFLSGGIDSSAIVALMRQNSNVNINSFSVTFDEQKFSEEKYATLVAQKFETIHKNIRLSSTDFLSKLPYAVNALDHPSGDGPNMYVVSKATKEAGITVALSGIGSDEIFAGYDFFKHMQSINNNKFIFDKLSILRKLSGFVLSGLSSNGNMQKIIALLIAKNASIQEIYPLWRSVYSINFLNELVPKNELYFPSITNFGAEKLITSISVAEHNTYLKHTLLRDTDQMSMAASLEVREPFLDHDLVNYVLSLPDYYKMGAGPKPLLVNALKNRLPAEIVNRPKMGFTLPWENWLKTSLNNYAKERIMELSTWPYFSKMHIEDLWKNYNKENTKVSWNKIWHLVVLSNWATFNKINIK